MKLVTFKTSDNLTHAGILRDNQVVALSYPTLLELLRDADAIPKGGTAVNRVCTYMGNELPSGRDKSGPYDSDNELPSGRDTQRAHGKSGPYFFPLDEVVLLAPIPDPPTLRDFYA